MKIFYVTQTFAVRLDHLLSVVSFINKPCDSVGRVSAPRAKWLSKSIQVLLFDLGVVRS